MFSFHDLQETVQNNLECPVTLTYHMFHGIEYGDNSNRIIVFDEVPPGDIVIKDALGRGFHGESSVAAYTEHGQIDLNGIVISENQYMFSHSGSSLLIIHLFHK
ncbi:unnamed protein product [Cunninghamella blakesleeana]